MSISPDEVQRSATSSLRETVGTNPSLSHGTGHHPVEAAGGDAAVAPQGISAVEKAGSSGLSHGLKKSSSYSNKNVISSRVLDSRKGSFGRKRGTLSQYQPIPHGGMPSEFKSDQIEHDQISGTSSETANFVHSDHLASSSSNVHVNATQSVSRRHQVVNANHLLNFHYDPISRLQPRTPPPPRRQQKIRPYNKDLFLQANYKFVVLDTGKYRLESMDPDKMLQWDDVICVRYSTPFTVQCPICLESPLCPQITSCGHIYCFPCILQYLLNGEDERKGECWKKCPLCFLMISPKDLYTIYIDKVEQFNVGDHVHFTLLTRSKDSLVPSLKNKQAELDFESSSSDGIWDSFAKFILTSDIDLSVRAAKSELSDWLSKAELGLVDDMERFPYVCSALEQLEERLKNWMDHRVTRGGPSINTSISLPSGSKTKPSPNKMPGAVLNLTSDVVSTYSDPWGSEAEALHERMTPHSSPLLLAAVPESDESSEKVFLPSHEDRSLHRSTNNCNDARESDSYTFYQASDGQHLILHPLNMKWLVDHYGSYDLLPQRISGDILELETVTQSEAMRRRYRFLSHFSLTTTFQLCEIDLSELLPPSSLAQHINEIKKREKQRKRVAKMEEEARAQAEAAALPDWTIPPNLNRMYEKDAMFSLDDFTALGNGVIPSTSPPITSGRKLFSNVTRLGFAAAHDSPSLTVEESGDPPENLERTGEASSIQGSRAASVLSFVDVISTVKTAESRVMQKANGLGKKGKKSNKLLLSTSGARRY